MVDDHDDARRYLDLFSGQLGAKVMVARNAFEGFEAIKNTRQIWCCPTLECRVWIFRAQDDRQFAWYVDKLGMVHDVGASKRDLEKEPQCRDALVDGRTPAPLAAR